MTREAGPSVAAILDRVWSLTGLDPAATAAVDLIGVEPVLSSSFRVDALAQAAVAAQGLAAAALHGARGGPAQRVSVDIRAASAEFRSERLLRIDGGPAPVWDALAGLYRCGDGRFVRLHTNFPHHREGIVRLLRCPDTREGVAAALEGWRAEAFETAATQAGLVVAMARRFEEWDAHPQAAALAALPTFEVTKIGDAPPKPAAAARPAAGLRVLDLTRIIAGPVAGRVLAGHGAEVLAVTAPHLPSVFPLVVDSGRGKRQTALDLRDEGGRAALVALLRSADVFVHGYRRGGLAALGFSDEAARAINPSIVVAQLSAYGRLGPWASKRGFDSLTQTATGLNFAEADAFGESTPRPLPCQALDHGAGHLLAAGIMAALARRAREGGAWKVEISLAQVGAMLRGLGRAEPLRAAAPDDAPYLEDADSGFGRLTAARPAARLSLTPPRYDEPAAPLGAHPPVWRAS
ncbi:MAG: CoA transferase [Rhodoblastus sp.]|nr:MAG: CoA transferase [Rhodoblastus sp.]